VQSHHGESAFGLSPLLVQSPYGESAFGLSPLLVQSPHGENAFGLSPSIIFFFFIRFSHAKITNLEYNNIFQLVFLAFEKAFKC
jgi:hypothetical protein